MAVKEQHTMAKKRENERKITVTDDNVDALLKEGIDAGFRNFKNYAEHIINERALLAKLKQVQGEK